MIRTFAQDDVEELARHATIPVDQRTHRQRAPVPGARRRDDDPRAARPARGRARSRYLGDGNNVCASLMVAAAKLGMDFVAATPEGYEPDAEAVELAREAGGAAGAHADDPARGGARGADVLYTDVWTSMGQEEERERRLRDLAGFGIDDELRRPRRRRCDRPPLPPRPLRRGDHRGRPLRAAVGRLGPGREPPARPEGADGARHP